MMIVIVATMNKAAEIAETKIMTIDTGIKILAIKESNSMKTSMPMEINRCHKNRSTTMNNNGWQIKQKMKTFHKALKGMTNAKNNKCQGIPTPEGITDIKGTRTELETSMLRNMNHQTED